ncbi:hypothetical protein LVY75_33115 (plasmid) [Sinorhizobium sp. B11]
MQRNVTEDPGQLLNGDRTFTHALQGVGQLVELSNLCAVGREVNESGFQNAACCLGIADDVGKLLLELIAIVDELGRCCAGNGLRPLGSLVLRVLISCHDKINLPLVLGERGCGVVDGSQPTGNAIGDRGQRDSDRTTERSQECAKGSSSHNEGGLQTPNRTGQRDDTGAG